MGWTVPPPDPTSPDLLTNLRAYLMSLNIVRDPRVAGPLPPMWIDTRFGLYAPNQKEGLGTGETAGDVVCEIKPATGIVPARYEGFIRRNHVEFVLRSRIPQPAISLENTVRASINDRRNWIMGIVPVIESLMYRDLQPLGSDNLGYSYNFEYEFQLNAPYSSISG